MSVLAGLCSGLHQYHFFNETKTWSEAQTYCRERYTDLATVDNEDDMEQLITATGIGYQGEVWIGLHDNSFDWEWSLGNLKYYQANDWNFRKWYPGEPNNARTKGQLCVVSLQGYLYDYFCNDLYAFVCYNSTHQLGE
uniref:C-type lectin domain-containing protein n=1 Tax=Anabas testudineus TaxID=64144 RepID=A0A3Q1IH76_ANATE